MTTTISKSFTAVGDSAILSLREQETVDVAISGTYAATIQLLRGKAGGGAWELLKTWSVADATVAYRYQPTKNNEQLKLRCSVFTSGTVVTTLTDTDFIQRTFLDTVGERWAQLSQAALALYRNLDITGTLAVSGAATVGGALTVTGATVVNGVPVAEAAANDPSQKNTLYDDFDGTTLSTRWTAITGTDPSAVAAAHVVGALNGTVAMTSGDTNPGTTAADAAGLVGARNWRADQGGLVLEARVKINDITLAKAFVGFTDNVALEFPVISNGTTGITATADDAVGFLFDTLATTDVWSGCGVAATVSSGVAINGSAPVNDIYDVLRVEIDATGAATFYQNGVQVGVQRAGAVTPTVLLTPILIVMENGVAAVRKLTCDYLWVQQNR